MPEGINTRRARLWKVAPHCYWCGRETHLEARNHGKGKDPLRATLDHMYSRFNPWRTSTFIQNIDFPQIVLACFDCNNWRGRLEEYLHRIRIANGEMHEIIWEANRRGATHPTQRVPRYGLQKLKRDRPKNEYSPFVSDSDLRKSEQY